MDNREYGSTSTCQSFDTNYKDSIVMVKELHASPSFVTKLKKIKIMPIFHIPQVKK